MNKIILLLVISISVFHWSYASDVIPIDNFDSSRYLGNWYEIARLPNRFENNCRPPIIATYALNPTNVRQIDVTNTCTTKRQQQSIVHGSAVFVGMTNVGQLKVTFVPKFIRWLSVGYGDYWVLYTDYNNVALVGSPDHAYLWILSRTNHLRPYILDKVMAVARDQGFDTDKLTFN